jgi:hypothetical protein
MMPSKHSVVTTIPAAAGIQEARIFVASLRDALLAPAQSPEGLVALLPGLSQAAAGMHLVEHELRADPSVPVTLPRVDSINVIRDLKSLKSELRAAANLIRHGAEFHRGWARLLGSAAAGYTSSGEAAPLAARGTVAIEA